MKLVINKVRKNGLEEVILYFKPGGKIYRIVFFYQNWNVLFHVYQDEMY